MSALKFFDVHTHVYPEKIASAACESLGRFYDFPVPGKGTVEDLSRVCIENGVSGALFLSVATNAHQVAKVNEGAAASVAYMRGRGLMSYAFAGYHQDCTDPAEVVAHAVSLGLCGFKLHPDIQGADIDDERFLPLYRLCEGARLPVYFHMGDDRPQYRFSEAVKLLRVIERFPDLRVGAAHLGGYSAWEDAHLLTEAPDIWFDTSSSLWAISSGYASELIHMLGPWRGMFGTDYPVKNADTEKILFEALDLTDGERKAVAFGNAMRFLGTGIGCE